MKRHIGFAVILLALVSAQLAAAEEDGDYAASIGPFLREYFAQRNSAMVIGLVDTQGSRLYSAGMLDNGTENKVDGDTVFFIGSVSKTFTALLLQDAVDQREVKLDDPVSKYLPDGVKTPSRGGKEITLLDLATHGSGLPVNPDNMTGADDREQYESYTVQKMYEFLSQHSLKRDPGSEFSYSNVGMALLGHVLARHAGTDFESLLIERVCKPLQLEHTRNTLTAEMKAHLAMGHENSGSPSAPWNLDAYKPAGNIHSSANDLLIYAAAQAGLTQSTLTPSIEKTHIIRFTDTKGLVPGNGSFGHTAMDWVDRGIPQPDGVSVLGHAGGAGSYHAFVGFDMKEKRGVVVLTTDNDLTTEAIGWNLLQKLPLTLQSTKEFAHELVGIGAALDLNAQTHVLSITRVFAKSPAAQAGLSAGLVIEKIDGASLEGKNMGDCLKLLRGPAGSKVQLEVVDPQSKESRVVEVTRAKFTTS
jgi:CubicO group peptidase (beta-lactamase class C family)